MVFFGIDVQGGVLVVGDQLVIKRQCRLRWHVPVEETDTKENGSVETGGRGSHEGVERVGHAGDRIQGRDEECRRRQVGEFIGKGQGTDGFGTVGGVQSGGTENAVDVEVGSCLAQRGQDVGGVGVGDRPELGQLVGPGRSG